MSETNREYAEPKLDWKIEKPGEHWTVEHESGSKLSVKLAVAGYTLTVETGDRSAVEHSIGSTAAHFLGAAERLYERYHSASATPRPSVEVQPEVANKPEPRVEVQPESADKPTPSADSSTEKAEPSAEPFIIISDEPKAEGSGA